ncbi:MAG: (2Fe-2S)-binding protein [Gammaproteobacteria bacterium]|nr:(2Fe-2S)-binding protein [Gammaproteobacteria bacterium]
MFVCVCNAITENDIRHAVNNGNETIKQIKQKFAVGDQCGGCVSLTKQIISEQLAVNACYYEVA